MNDTIYPRFRNDVDEVQRRFPSADLIDDPDVYMETVEALQVVVPSYFFEAPAASSYDYHNPYCVDERGLWIHTLMVATAYERLVDTYVCQDRITDLEADLGRAAVLLHDARKHGDEYQPGDSAAKDHDIQAAEWICENTGLDDRVADAVAAHMGPWYEGPEPETPLQQLVHQADMVASTKNGTFGVYEAPREIAELYPSLPGAHL